MGILIAPGNGGLTGDCDIVNNPCLLATFEKKECFSLATFLSKPNLLRSRNITSYFQPIDADILDLHVVAVPCPGDLELVAMGDLAM